jgi:hypothetical protein
MQATTARFELFASYDSFAGSCMRFKLSLRSDREELQQNGTMKKCAMLDTEKTTCQWLMRVNARAG